MKDYTIGHSEFSDKVSIVESNDPAHADVINTPIKQLFGNTVANKRAVEKSKEQVEAKLQTFKNEISESQTELNKSVEKTMNDIKESNATLGKSIKDIADKNEFIEKMQLLNDYKMYGEASYVFQRKDLLYALYEYTELSMNDLDINSEALEYFIKENKHVGQALAKVQDIEQASTLNSLITIQEVINNSKAMNAIVHSATAMNAIANSSMALNAVRLSDRMLNAIAINDVALKAVINSAKAMEAIFNNSLIISKIVKNTDVMNEIVNNTVAMDIIADSTTAMSEFANNSAAIQAIVGRRVALDAIVNSTTAMNAIANSSMALNAIANSTTAIAALANSSLRKTLGIKQKVDNGVMLVMGIGYNHYLDINSSHSGGIKFKDGTTYPTQNKPIVNENQYPIFGSFLKFVPKVATHIRSYATSFNNSNSTMDIILIKGNIINY